MLYQRSADWIIVVCVLSVFLLLTGCGQKDDGQENSDAMQETEASSVSDTGDMMARNAELLKGGGSGNPIEPLSVETLKEFLPPTLVGMDRDDPYTDSMTVMEVKTTEAWAEYAKVSGPGDMKLSITDVTDATGPISMVMTYWVMTDVNNGNDTEYEKTTTYKGYKAFEEYNNSGPSGTFTVLVANRFLVEVSGSRVTMETLKKAAGEVDLKKLAAAAK